MRLPIAVGLVAVAGALVAAGASHAQAPDPATPYTPSYTPPAATSDVTSGDYCPWHHQLLSLADVLGFPCACEGTGNCVANWAVSVDGLYMQRSNSYDTPLVYRASDNLVLLGDNSLQKDFHTGARATATRRWGESCELEFSYMGIDGFGGSQSLSDPNGLTVYGPNFGPITIVGGGRLDVDYRSQLHSGEFLLRHRQDWLGYSAGIRMLDVQEALSETLIRQAFPPEHIWRTDTSNFLVGLQVGTDITLWQRSERFRANVAMKVGVYNNYASQLSQSDTGLHPPFRATTDLAAYVGELDFTGQWKLSPHLSLRGGYQLMWIDNIALAPQQIGVTNLPAGTGNIDAKGNIFAHGASVGLEVAF